VKLENVLPWGRSFNEYREIFNLTDNDLELSILGCGDGPASFNAELTFRGGKVVSVDPIYKFNSKQLQVRISEAFDQIMPQAEKHKEMYLWKNIPSVSELGRIRMAAMSQFLTDFEAGKATGRYVADSLPNLRFKDKHFDLALCSHYLFLYSKQVNVEQHIDAIKELCRVAREVRIYPVISLDGETSPHLSEVTTVLGNLGQKVTLEDVPYQFQKGATQMLVVKSA
jgi:hypothetical protein